MNIQTEQRRREHRAQAGHMAGIARAHEQIHGQHQSQGQNGLVHQSVGDASVDGEQGLGRSRPPHKHVDVGQFPGQNAEGHHQAPPGHIPERQRRERPGDKMCDGIHMFLMCSGPFGFAGG